MFKFDFDLDDLADDPELAIAQGQNIACQAKTDEIIEAEEPCREIPIQELLDALPSQISCSPLTISLRDGTRSITLSRRDLFDARFQLIAEGSAPDDFDGEEAGKNGPTEGKERRHVSALAYIEAPSDLVPRVYEGGLKTWECSIDLVEYLDAVNEADKFRGKDILELGCGTAIPSLYILNRLLFLPLPNDTTQLQKTAIYLQDYNDSVLEFVTLPNILLTWYLSPASLSYRSSKDNDIEAEHLPFPTTPEPFELSITPCLKSAFLASLQETYNISLRFFSGAWSSFPTQLKPVHPDAFDVVLTSETIYQTDSLPSLITTMRTACFGESNEPSEKAQCLVAAKVLYFGVGGGVSDFVDFMVKNGYGKAETVRERKVGVGRVIMSLNWSLN